MATLIDNLIENIQRLQSQGVQRVRISDENLRLFFDDSLKPEKTVVKENPQPEKPQLTYEQPTAKMPDPPVEVAEKLTVEYKAEPETQAETQTKIKNMTLVDIRQRGNTCSACQLDIGEMRSQDVAQNSNAKLMIITEPSGSSTAQMADPFAGEAGELLCKMIRAMNVSLNDIYLCMAHRCFGPDARKHIKETKPFLEEQINRVNPEVILIFGGAALNILLGEQSLMKSRGQWLEINDIPTMVTYPPAYLLRKENGKREAWKDMQQVMARLQL